MKYPMTMALLAAGSAAAAAAAVGSTAVRAEEGCAVSAAKPPKKRGLGGLLSAARSSGLEGSLAGATRGDGNLASDLKGSSRRAAEGGASESMAASGCRETAPKDDAAEASAAGGARPAETSTQRARREMAASDLKYPSRMPIPDEWKTAKAAYDEFGKVKCMSCEGGFAFSGWPDWPRDEFSGKYGGAETRLSRLPLGHVHRWSANGFSGTLTVDGEEQVNGFRCRKMTYRLEKGGQSASRPSLLCWGKANQYSGSDSWVGVF